MVTFFTVRKIYRFFLRFAKFFVFIHEVYEWKKCSKFMFVVFLDPIEDWRSLLTPFLFTILPSNLIQLLKNEIFEENEV
jgi:hypothetical protein